ncbi:hypothetical protein, partial [uncultured Helicobacter sp.]|uniref:hypothetical protein n=1 Tax=uncultured Helicobacter sp. TaxID=175537 RepID=UPI00375028D6
DYIIDSIILLQELRSCYRSWAVKSPLTPLRAHTRNLWRDSVFLGVRISLTLLGDCTFSINQQSSESKLVIARDLTENLAHPKDIHLRRKLESIADIA